MNHVYNSSTVLYISKASWLNGTYNYANKHGGNEIHFRFKKQALAAYIGKQCECGGRDTFYLFVSQQMVTVKKN